MSGTIGVLTMELSRYSYFSASVSCTKKPEGTHEIWTVGQQSGRSVIEKQNWLVENMKGDWLWILGDDHEFADDALMRLLAHDADIVVPVNVARAMDFLPLVFDPVGNKEDWTFLDGVSGLKEVTGACGNAGMLIKRHVFNAIPAPWFEWDPEGSPYQGSDLAFCWKARQAGFKVHIDTEVVFGHTNVATFTPVRIADKKFAVMMTIQGRQVALFRFKEGQQTTLFQQVGLG